MMGRQLVETRKYLEDKFPDFPNGHCLDAAKEVQERFGFDIVEGVILCDDGPQHHVFNYDKSSRRYVDLSSDQFPGFAEKVLITPEDGNMVYRGVRCSE